MTSRRGLAPLVAAVLVGGLLAAGRVGGVPTSLAHFTAADAASTAFATTRVLPPTDLAGTGGSTVALAWTPTASTWATGYELLRSATSGSGYTVVASITPIVASTAGDAPPPGTWYYALRTVFHDWTSALSNEVAVVIDHTSVTTPPAWCAEQAAETVDAGDNNGYEGNPGRACGAPDGSLAVDRDSGTSTTNSCLADSKDKHRFWGFAIDLPDSVTAINGITVQPVLSQSNNGGTTWLCVQLSADGGSTWSTARRVTLTTNTLTTQTFGGPSETWGMAWAPADFGDGFRVRVIDSSTQGAKDFRLDAIGVSVTYTP